MIVGGGATGCEIAGEIKKFHPGKEVTRVHSGKNLMDNMFRGEGEPREWAKRQEQAAQQLREMGVVEEKIRHPCQKSLRKP